MHTYTLTITKDDIVLEFKSTDNEIVAKELGVWIEAAAKIWDDMPPYEPEEEIQPEKIELGEIIWDSHRPKANKEEAPQIAPIEEVEEEPVALPKPQTKKFVPPPPPQEEHYQPYKISEETKEILQRAIHKPKHSMREVLREEKPIPQRPAEPTFEPLNIEVQKASLYQEPKPMPTPIQPLEQPEDFTSIFNQKMVQETKSTDKFAQLLSLQNIHTKLDCLVACAYHLVERENFERFTLKQINTLSRALIEDSIEHDTVKEALEKRLIKIVPDYTGIATTMEYTLTDQGTKYFEREIAD